MRGHGVGRHRHDEKLRGSGKEKDGDESVLLFVRPDVLHRSVKSEDGERGEKRIEKSLQVNALKKRPQGGVDGQVGGFPGMGLREVIDVGRFD